MGKTFNHLTYDTRLLIKQMLESGNSKKEIAIQLGLSLSTVYREIERNSNIKGYEPEFAQQKYEKMLKDKGRKSKLASKPELATYISKLVLEEKLSPSKIAERLCMEDYPERPLSRNTIYSAIDKGLIPEVSRDTLKHKKTHMFSNGILKVPVWILEELDMCDNEELNIDVVDGKIVIEKSK